METPPFAGRVSEGMRRSGVTLRQLCRDVGLDASFFSKVLSGKRSPPMDEGTLRRIAERLALDPAELVVAAGRIPAEWRGLWSDPDLFRGVHALATNGDKGFAARSAEGKKGKELRRRSQPFTPPGTTSRLPEAADLDTELL